jgi:hypothetical protein
MQLFALSFFLSLSLSLSLPFPLLSLYIYIYIYPSLSVPLSITLSPPPSPSLFVTQIKFHSINLLILYILVNYIPSCDVYHDQLPLVIMWRHVGRCHICSYWSYHHNRQSKWSRRYLIDVLQIHRCILLFSNFMRVLGRSCNFKGVFNISLFLHFSNSNLRFNIYFLFMCNFILYIILNE